MTIIIGMKCKSGVLVTCDSRTTDPTGAVRDTARKLTLIDFKDGNQGIVAEAGNDVMSSRCVEILKAMVRDSELSDYRSLSDIAERSMAELKAQIRKQYSGTAEETQKHFEAHAFELMLAYYFDSKPYIFTVDFALGIARQTYQPFVSIGCGWALSDFLLSSLGVEDFEMEHGMWTAVYAVEQIKRFDSRCGGPTRSAVVQLKDGMSKAFMGRQEWMDKTVAEVNSFSRTYQQEWKTKITEVIRRIVASSNTPNI